MGRGREKGKKLPPEKGESRKETHPAARKGRCPSISWIK